MRGRGSTFLEAAALIVDEVSKEDTEALVVLVSELAAAVVTVVEACITMIKVWQEVVKKIERCSHSEGVNHA